MIAISSNSPETHPQDGPDAMAEDAKAQGGPPIPAYTHHLPGWLPILPAQALPACLPGFDAACQTSPPRAGYTFPYLFDATTAVAQQYQAACTPEFYVFNSDLKLVSPGARHAFDAFGGPVGVGIASQQKQEY